MAITAEQVKELREATGLGMMICKKALTEADGDMKQAMENLRKQGQATAQKRAGKAAKEGKVSVLVQDSTALIYEVNSETDFVARNDDFLAFVDQLGPLLASEKPADLDAAHALTAPAFDGQTVSERLTDLIGKIGEKITFRRFALVETDPSRQRVHSYVHGNGRIGVVVVLSADSGQALDTGAVADLGKEIAMQVAAANPMAVSRESVPAEIIEKEREVYRAQAEASGRPEKVWDRIVDGKLGKFYKESVLVEQEYIRDSDMSVADRIKQAEKDAGCTVGVDSFVRFELGSEEPAS
ncbi:MAG: elongation factor Ts [Chitinivibrionales bacterium]|nr:elongation factor Ts [Chitinivibrionales bacterium]MBD3394522.1 elongation factor Ts [Chitinivibrionales bacterium]